MPGLTTIPPFPDDVPTYPLITVDYDLIKADDQAEIDKLWKAATELGFWYLKNHGLDTEVNAMFDMGAETMRLPLEEKMKFEQGDEGVYFGYKAAGVNAIDEKGTLDATEFLNVSKDDALAWPQVAHRTYPAPAQDRMGDTIKPFVERSLAVNATLLAVLEKRLGIPEGELAKLHRPEKLSGCVARISRVSPQNVVEEAKRVLQAHTDFGSLTLLHNRLGGLQVLVPGTDDWLYVKPMPGYAICNLGDAMAYFSGGIMRSNLHRVVAPPKEQGKFERFSLVFLQRPEDTVVLRALPELSPLIAEAVAKTPEKNWDTGVTSKEWMTRRFKNIRIKNYKGPETWKASRGTETVLS
ncbi:Clavaminate synthase-like protein [Obba rivulosa]|uniref:Clavaminate synthase-like protein n=1 Tax=Obba rivulosa TaxID=1052685 RepID=A0A8E2DQ49_9APHY|nr:Clavaminate synthase-like protein [Obba rivulosa]